LFLVFSFSKFGFCIYIHTLQHQISGHMIPLCIDCELHQGKDGRQYLIDLSRIMPPEEPVSTIQSPHLFRMLRSEFLRNLSMPVCSDGFSSFVAKEKDRSVHNAELVQATRKLRDAGVPAVATLIDQLHTTRDDELEFFQLEHLHRVLHITHAFGVNNRYLGLLLTRSLSCITKQVLLVEIVARTVKRLLRRKLRQLVVTPTVGVTFDNTAR
jgi:hypothetical protein